MQKFQSKGKILGILALAVLANAAFVNNAKADDWHGRDHDRAWHAHELEMRRWHRLHPIPQPAVVYAPPAVVYAPPPPPPGISLVIPLGFR